MLESLIRISYPYPMAATYKSIEDIIYEAEMPIKYNRIIDLYDSILKVLTYSIVGYAINSNRMTWELNKELKKTLKNPIPSNWTGLLSSLLDHLYPFADPLTNSIYDFYYGKDSRIPGIRSAVYYMMEGPKSVNEVSQMSVSYFFEHYNSFISRADMENFNFVEGVDRLLPAFQEVLLKLEFLKDYAFVYVPTIRVEGKMYDHDIDVLSGLSPIKTRIIIDHALPEGNRKVYLFRISSEGYEPLYSLHPFVTVNRCSKHNKDEIYFLRYFQNDEMDYYCFQCRERFLPNRLIVDFEDALAEERRTPEEVSDEAIEVYRELLRVAWGDGVITEDERSKLDFLRDHFNISDKLARNMEENVRRQLGVSKVELSLREVREFEDLVRNSMIKNTITPGMRDFIAKYREDRHIPENYAKKTESRLWYEEGLRKVKAGDTESARTCFFNAQLIDKENKTAREKMKELSNLERNLKPEMRQHLDVTMESMPQPVEISPLGGTRHLEGPQVIIEPMHQKPYEKPETVEIPGAVQAEPHVKGPAVQVTDKIYRPSKKKSRILKSKRFRPDDITPESTHLTKPKYFREPSVSVEHPREKPVKQQKYDENYEPEYKGEYENRYDPSKYYGEYPERYEDVVYEDEYQGEYVDEYYDDDYPQEEYYEEPVEEYADEPPVEAETQEMQTVENVEEEIPDTEPVSPESPSGALPESYEVYEEEAEPQPVMEEPPVEYAEEYVEEYSDEAYEEPYAEPEIEPEDEYLPIEEPAEREEIADEFPDFVQVVESERVFEEEKPAVPAEEIPKAEEQVLEIPEEDPAAGELFEEEDFAGNIHEELQKERADVNAQLRDELLRDVSSEEIDQMMTINGDEEAASDDSSSLEEEFARINESDEFSRRQNPFLISVNLDDEEEEEEPVPVEEPQAEPVEEEPLPEEPIAEEEVPQEEDAVIPEPEPSIEEEEEEEFIEDEPEIEEVQEETAEEPEEPEPIKPLEEDVEEFQEEEVEEEIEPEVEEEEPEEAVEEVEPEPEPEEEEEPTEELEAVEEDREESDVEPEDDDDDDQPEDFDIEVPAFDFDEEKETSPPEKVREPEPVKEEPKPEKEPEEEKEESPLANVPPLETLEMKERLKYVKIIAGQLSKVKRLIKNEDYNGAMLLLNDVLLVDPMNLVARLLRGKCAVEEGEFERAFDDLEKILKIKGDDPTLLMLHSKAALEIGELETAVKDAGIILEKMPRNRDAYFLRGSAHLDLDNFEKAIADFDKYIELSKDEEPDIDAWINRGSCWYEIEEYDNAIADFLKAAEIDPRDGFPLFKLAKVYLALNNYDLAMKYFEEALIMESDESEYKAGKALVYEKLGKDKKALKELKKIIKSDPEFEDAYVQLGQLLEKMERHDKALEVYTKFIDMDFDNEEKMAKVHILRGRLLGQIGRVDEALQDFEEASILVPEKADSYLARGNFYMDVEEYDEAVEAFSEVLDVDPDCAEGYLHRGIAYEKQGDMESALDDFKEYMQVNRIRR